MPSDYDLKRDYKAAEKPFRDLAAQELTVLLSNPDPKLVEELVEETRTIVDETVELFEKVDPQHKFYDLMMNQLNFLIEHSQSLTDANAKSKDPMTLAVMLTVYRGSSAHIQSYCPD